MATQVGGVGVDFRLQITIKDPKKQNYFRRLLSEFDIFVNVIFGGQRDETISSRCSKGAIAGNKFAKFMIWWLDLLAPNHFQKAPAGDEIAATEALQDLESSTHVTPVIKND